MQPELNCEKCGWRPVVTVPPSAVACPECGALLTNGSDDESTVAWAPPGERVPHLVDEDPETEFLIGDPDALDPSDSGKRTTVQDIALPPGMDGEQGVRKDESGSAIFDTGIASLPVESGLPLIVATPPGSESTIDSSSTSAIDPSAFTAPPLETTSPVLERRPSPGLSSPPAEVSRSPAWVKLVVSYASAVTLACLYLLYLVWKGGPSLDLPDLAPPATRSNRVTTLLYVPPEQVIPANHQLRLGETQQFGSLRVTPLRVSRGPLAFSYFDPTVAETRPETGPVLKLVLRLENASADQEFTPLDRKLVYTKEPDKVRLGSFKANNFLCEIGQRTELDRHVLVYDLAPDSSWIVRGENLDADLKPGETVEAFIPTTEEGWNDLTGELVWRVHLRKGYNRDSLRGVTTLVEVRFLSSDIVDEGPAA
jgi:hypothetical protein